MRYAKPEVVTLAPAVDAVQSNPLIKGTTPASDSFQTEQVQVISAYEADD